MNFKNLISLQTILELTLYYPHFTDAESEVQRHSDTRYIQLTQLVRRNVSISLHFCLTQISLFIILQKVGSLINIMRIVNRSLPHYNLHRRPKSSLDLRFEICRTLKKGIYLYSYHRIYVGMYKCTSAKSLQLCPTLSDPMD